MMGIPSDPRFLAVARWRLSHLCSRTCLSAARFTSAGCGSQG